MPTPTDAQIVARVRLLAPELADVSKVSDAVLEARIPEAKALTSSRIAGDYYLAALARAVAHMTTLDLEPVGGPNGSGSAVAPSTGGTLSSVSTDRLSESYTDGGASALMAAGRFSVAWWSRTQHGQVWLTLMRSRPAMPVAL